MLGRLPLLLVFLLVFVVGGCATVSEERLTMLESAVLDLQANDMRLASLEETVAKLAAQNPSGSAAGPGEPVKDLQTRPGPRRVSPDPAPARPVAASSATPAPAPAPTPVATSASVPAPAAAPAPVPVAPPASATVPVAAPAPASLPAPVPVKTAAAPAPVGKISNAQAVQQYQSALSTLEAGRAQTAMGLFREFIARFPGHSLAPNAGYWLGECYYSMKQYDSAIIAFKDVVAQFPAHEKAAAAMLKAGYCYALKGDNANARFYLQTLVKDFPASQPASLARTRLASL